MKNDIADFECKMVKNAKTGAGALLLDTEFLATWHGRSCLNQ
jgi:hypothetical protein